ncbi:MAG: GNAT family N-acetyltransferase [Methylobacteriaceae bacterium]|nr:GNAT family N-acetyltransferase [Methylobacteriaceae bacterium]
MTIALRRAGAADIAAVAAIQNGAYARNRAILGVEPIPLKTSAAAIVAGKETWIAEEDGQALGALALEQDGDALLIWSVATHPQAQGRGLGNLMLDLAHRRAREAGARRISLYTGEKLTSNVEWYLRRGFSIDRVEDMGDRRAVHMSKAI